MLSNYPGIDEQNDYNMNMKRSRQVRKKYMIQVRDDWGLR